MEPGWQDLVALGMVALAVLYLGRMFAGTFRRGQASGCASGCGKCSSRSRANVGEPHQVVEIGTTSYRNSLR